MTVTRTGPHHFRIDRTLGDTPVSKLIVVDRLMRFGCAQVRMAGIGGVWTNPEYRKQGHMRAVMDYLVEFMIAEGFDLSLLFGIRHFYPRWGYATMIPEYELVIPTENAATAASKLKVRASRKGEMPRIIEIYNSLNARRTGSLVRPPFPDNEFPMGSDFFTKAGLLVVEDEIGEIIGYAAYDRQTYTEETHARVPIVGNVIVAEAGASQPRAYDALLKRLARIATQRGIAEIQACVPPDDPFSLHCRSYGAQQRITTQTDGGPMMRIVNLAQLLAKIEPELARRVAGKSLSGSLSLATDIGAANLKLTQTGVRVSRRAPAAEITLQLEQWKLLQLLIGYRTIADVLADPRQTAFPPGSQAFESASVSPLLAQFAEALFPQQWAFCWHPDWF